MGKLTARDVVKLPDKLKIDKADLLKLASMVVGIEGGSDLIDKIVTPHVRSQKDRERSKSNLKHKEGSPHWKAKRREERRKLKKERQKANRLKIKKTSTYDYWKKFADDCSKDLIKRATPEELIFKKTLDKCKIKYKFQEPYVILENNRNCFIIDFVLPEINKIIEIDGNQHYEPDAIERDNAKEIWIKNYKD